MQSVDRPERERVLISVDETNVRLVPDEGPGHVSKRAYRLFLEGVTMGRRASLAQRRSTVTHVAAITDKPNFQRILPQVVRVGQNELKTKLHSPRFDPTSQSARTFETMTQAG